MIDDTIAAGWDAIDAALARLYPGVTPLHYGTLLNWSLGGPDPLDGISVYPRDDHWHFVSYGMSELYDKQSEVAEESGWGFEFTFRVARDHDEAEPPMWAADFLQNLGRYVFSSANPFAPGHHIDLNGPISQENPETAIRAAAFAEDPELGTIGTPHGRLRFLQVVGLTLGEYEAIGRWDALGLLGVLRTRLPLLVTDLTRDSVIDDPDLAAAIEDGARRDGSSTGGLYVQEARWKTDSRPEKTVLTFGANAAERIAQALAGRLPYGRDLSIAAPGGGVRLRPGDHVTVTESGDGYVEVEIPPDVLSELTTVLHPTAGVHVLRTAPGLIVEIVESRIRDQEGNVVEVIG
ncbi:hypothetical protein Psi02_74920 [Planotetraspora silvatica]|uniref:Suppressor of fused-like domain-containing protein n=1 Tax=Planotetraspora silvatica TaxID=234614 RepID=A0A8J3UTM4_9ACTN|nr:suppressor of fused domain protein [Planotetraspora silvatica]GII51068.1 hypothetical protein Psi02_74920 [Planotetraspora silvatica]